MPENNAFGSPPVSRAHGALIELGNKLGYFTEENEAGICHGVTMAWIEACLCNEINKFDTRLKNIKKANKNPVPFFQDLLLIKQKVIQHISLSSIERSKLDVLGFYEKILLYQMPYKYSDLFDEKLTQGYHAANVAKLISSDIIQQHGGCVFFSNRVNTYSQVQFREYLEALATTLSKTQTRNPSNVCFKIGGGRHSMGISYVGIDHWEFLDINLGETYQMTSDQISTHIYKHYFNNQGTMQLMTHAITTADYIDRAQLEASLNAIQHYGTLERDELTVLVALKDGTISILDQFDNTFISNIIEALLTSTFEKQLDTANFISPRALIYLLQKGCDANMIFKFAARINNQEVINACMQYPEVVETCAITTANLIINQLQQKEQIEKELNELEQSIRASQKRKNIFYNSLETYLDLNSRTKEQEENMERARYQYEAVLMNLTKQEALYTSTKEQSALINQTLIELADFENNLLDSLKTTDSKWHVLTAIQQIVDNKAANGDVSSLDQFLQDVTAHIALPPTTLKQRLVDTKAQFDFLQNNDPIQRKKS